MCCTLEPAHLSETILLAHETTHPETGRVIHVAGYQNKAQSYTTNLLSQPRGSFQSIYPRELRVPANAMILPFPSRVQMGPENVLDTRKARHIMADYARAIEPPRLTRGTKGRSDGMMFAAAAVEVFESGSYHIALARDASAIPSALDRVPEEKRPRVNQDIFDAYAKFYPAHSWQLALCCWAGTVDAEPMLWWYEPNDPDYLFFPALDAHDGRPPKLGIQVPTDHSLVIGTSKQYENVPFHQVYFQDNVPEDLRPFLPTRVNGIEHHGSQHNGDWRFAVANFRHLKDWGNRPFFERVSPPGA